MKEPSFMWTSNAEKQHVLTVGFLELVFGSETFVMNGFRLR